MKRLFLCVLFVASLAAAYEAGRRELGAELLSPRIFAVLERVLGTPSARDPADSALDPQAARARLEQHLSTLRTQREHLDQERRLRSLEERVLTRWGETDEAGSTGPRTARVRELTDRMATLDGEIAAAQRALELSENAASDRASTATPELRAAKIALREVHLERELAPSTR